MKFQVERRKMYKKEVSKIVHQLKNKLNYKYLLFDKVGKLIQWNFDNEKNFTENMLEKVIKNKTEIMIEDENSADYGLYIPLMYKLDIEYIVLLKENPKELKKNLHLIKGFLELLISENRNNSRETLREELEKSFLIELLAMGNLDCSELIDQKSKLLKFDMNKERRVILIDVIQLKKRFKYTKDKEIKISELIKKIREIILKYLNIDEYCYNIFEDKFVIIKDYLNEDDTEEFLRKISSSIEKICGFEIIIFVSDMCSKTLDYPIQYRKLLRLHKMYAFNLSKPKKILFTSYDEVEMFFKSFSDKEKKVFLQHYREILEAYKDNKEIIKTVEVFFKNNMDTLDTSEVLGIHRNTVNYRLKKFVADTGIDVYKPYDCMKVYIVICLMK